MGVRCICYHDNRDLTMFSIDSWNVVICLMISLSRFTSFTHCAKSCKRTRTQNHSCGNSVHLSEKLTGTHAGTYSHSVESRAQVSFVCRVGRVFHQLLERQKAAVKSPPLPRTCTRTYLEQQGVLEDSLHGDHEQVSEGEATIIGSLRALLRK